MAAAEGIGRGGGEKGKQMKTTNLMGPGFMGTSMPAMQPITTTLAPAPGMMPMPMLCLEWVVLDIETQGGDPNQVWEWVRRNWWPNEDHKPETMAKKLVEAVEKKKEKLALLDSAQVVMVQLKTSAGQVVVFHAFGAEAPVGSGIVAHDNEASLLRSVAQWMELNCGEGTTIVGWNIKGFDLPRLRLRMVKCGVRVPRVLTGMCGVLDLMREYARNWSVERTEFIALGDALEAFGLENHKKDTDGSMVGELIERQEFGRLIDYGIKDVTEEAGVFLRMTGQVGC